VWGCGCGGCAVLGVMWVGVCVGVGVGGWVRASVYG